MQKLSFFLRERTAIFYWVIISLSFWCSHILLRALLLFRSNPYGFPFVSKPDWFIFHAICIDFLWIVESLFIFVVLFEGLKKIVRKKSAQIEIFGVRLYAVFHSAILLITLLDHELLRFLGSHLSFGLVNTYKDTSSVSMFYDYVANDYSIPYLQFVLLLILLPLTYFIYRLLKYFFFLKREKFLLRAFISIVLFYIASNLFVYVIWSGNARMTKLRPVVSLVFRELTQPKGNAPLEKEAVSSLGKFYQSLWENLQGDSLWYFPPEKISENPLYREPRARLQNDSLLRARRAARPNFIVVFLESHRGLNTGFLNPEKKSPTPFLDSLALHSRFWSRMHTSGLPTTGGILSSHIGIPHHSSLAEATDLAHVFLPSFASIFSDSGYSTHYFSAADPAWDNLSIWAAKWYTKTHYNRHREDDSLFFEHAKNFIRDTLGKSKTPFLATLLTRSNHYPFNFAGDMTEEEKNLPLTERIQVTMHYADRQLEHFLRALENEPWYKNTYVIILADHAFPLGENGVSTMNGGGFSNATWIPFLIHGEGIEIGNDTSTASQIDISPTLLELAGIVSPNMFMGHNLLRGYGNGLSLGAYSKVAAIGLENFRLIVRYPISENEIDGLFAEGDTRQEKNWAKENDQKVKYLKGALDSLIQISDYSLERGW